MINEALKYQCQNNQILLLKAKKKIHNRKKKHEKSCLGNVVICRNIGEILMIFESSKSKKLFFFRKFETKKFKICQNNTQSRQTQRSPKKKHNKNFTFSLYLSLG
jgi:hypothetical protein